MWTCLQTDQLQVRTHARLLDVVHQWLSDTQLQQRLPQCYRVTSVHSMSNNSERRPLRDCANVTADTYSSGAAADGALEKEGGAVPAFTTWSADSPEDSRKALRDMQQACTAMVQREAENTMLLMEDAARVRARRAC